MTTDFVHGDRAGHGIIFGAATGSLAWVALKNIGALHFEGLASAQVGFGCRRLLTLVGDGCGGDSKGIIRKAGADECSKVVAILRQGDKSGGISKLPREYNLSAKILPMRLKVGLSRVGEV